MPKASRPVSVPVLAVLKERTAAKIRLPAVFAAPVLMVRKGLIFHLFSVMTFFRSLRAVPAADTARVRPVAKGKTCHTICA